MKKYTGNIVKRSKRFIKKVVIVYFYKADVYVTLISFICLLWMILYKTYLITKEPLFENANTVAELSYTVFSSIVAAGLFYIFTVFIPRCSAIYKMKTQLSFYIKGISEISASFVININIDGTKEKYSIDGFIEKISNKDKTVIRDFIAFLKKKDVYDSFIDTESAQMQLVDCILTSYADLLPQETYIQLVELKHINSYVVKRKTSDPNKMDELYLRCYGMFVKMIIISENMKKLYNLKEWNNTMTMSIKF